MVEFRTRSFPLHPHILESDDFITQLIDGDRICISGYWKQKDGKYQEEIKIYSALAAEESAEALVCTLMGYEDANEFKLPEYEDEEEHNSFLSVAYHSLISWGISPRISDKSNPSSLESKCLDIQYSQGYISFTW